MARRQIGYHLRRVRGQVIHNRRGLRGRLLHGLPAPLMNNFGDGFSEMFRRVVEVDNAGGLREVDARHLPDPRGTVAQKDDSRGSAMPERKLRGAAAAMIRGGLEAGHVGSGVEIAQHLHDGFLAPPQPQLASRAAHAPDQMPHQQPVAHEARGALLRIKMSTAL